MHGHAYDVAYVNGPNGKRICTVHTEEFDPPHQCPRCLKAHAAPARSPSLDPGIAAAITDEVLMFEGIAEEAGAAADNAQSDSGRAALMRRLAEDGIGSQVHYIPVHRQPYYAARYPELALPGADAYYARCLSLPLFAAMTEDDVARVAAALAAALAR